MVNNKVSNTTGTEQYISYHTIPANFRCWHSVLVWWSLAVYWYLVLYCFGKKLVQGLVLVLKPWWVRFILYILMLASSGLLVSTTPFSLCFKIDIYFFCPRDCLSLYEHFPLPLRKLLGFLMADFWNSRGMHALIYCLWNWPCSCFTFN